jgi:hypothetical protein
LAILNETIGASTETVINKYKISYSGIVHAATRFNWPHPIRKWAQGKPEHAFTEAQRLQILNRVHAATKFGEISQIVLDEGATIPMVYQWAKLLEVPIVLHQVDPLQKQQIKRLLSADPKSARDNSPTQRSATFAKYAKIAKESSIPIEVLEMWDFDQYCDEEIWRILEEPAPRSDEDVARIYKINPGTVGKWRTRFGVGPKSVEYRALESFTKDQLRAFIDQVNTGAFSVLTTLADENGFDPVALYVAAKNLGVPLALKPVDLPKKKAIVAALRAYAAANKGDPGYENDRHAKYRELGATSGYGVRVIRTWDEGEFTAEEGLQIVRDRGRRTGAELARIHEIAIKTVYRLQRKYEGVVGANRAETRSAESLTKEELVEYIAQIHEADEFGAFTRIADENNFTPATLFRAAKTAGIPVKLHPVDPQTKHGIVAELNAHADAIKGLTHPQRLRKREIKCAELAEKFGYDIRTIRVWAHGDYTADEIIQILTEGVGQTTYRISKTRQLSTTTVKDWRNKFGFKE